MDYGVYYFRWYTRPPWLGEEDWQCANSRGERGWPQVLSPHTGPCSGSHLPPANTQPINGIKCENMYFLQLLPKQRLLFVVWRKCVVLANIYQESRPLLLCVDLILFQFYREIGWKIPWRVLLLDHTLPLSCSFNPTIADWLAPGSVNFGTPRVWPCYC